MPIFIKVYSKQFLYFVNKTIYFWLLPAQTINKTGLDNSVVIGDDKSDWNLV